METALILCRFLQFAVAMLLWGAAVLRAGTSSAGLHMSPVVVRLAAGVNLFAGLGWLAAEAALAGEGPWDAANPEVLAALLAGSRFGHVWVLHLAFAAVLLGVRWCGRPRGLAVLAGLNLGSLGLTGHAVLAGGWWHQAMTAVHLLAAGFWLGGLVVILPMLTPGGLTEATVPALRAFSRWGHWAVALVIMTGIGKAVVILSAREGFGLSGPYWVLLMVKTGAVAVMLGLALVNRYWFVPRLGAGGLVALRRGTLAEVVLMALVLGLVSLFATLSPFAVR